MTEFTNEEKRSRVADACPNERLVMRSIIAMIRDWQEKGRNGHCLPVINGKLLYEIEVLADKVTQENCSWCNGSGKITDGYESIDCKNCNPLSYITENSKCIYPDCECLDYCEAHDPYSEPKRKKKSA